MARIPKPPSVRQGHRSKAPAAERGGADETVADREQPAAPAGLLKRTRDIWLGFWLSAIAQAVDWRADRFRLERWIYAVDEYERVRREFRKQRIVPGSRGQDTLNPLATYLAQLESTITAAETALGMTPMARLRLGIALGTARLTAAEVAKRLDAPAIPREITEGTRLALPEPSGGEVLDTSDTWEAEWQEA